jgi:hypothetical protein
MTRARAAHSASRLRAALTRGPPRSVTGSRDAAAVSSGERFLAAGGSSDRSTFTVILLKPTRIKATTFPQIRYTTEPRPTAMADGRGAWRYAGESRPSHVLPNGVPPSWTPSGPTETTITDGDGAEPMDRVSTWPAAMARPCAVAFRPG